MPIAIPSVVAGTIGTAALGGLGAWGAASALSNTGKQSNASMPAMAPAPVSPNPAAAEESAIRAVELKRKMRALSGGKTLLTQSGYAVGTGAGQKTLLGS